MCPNPERNERITGSFVFRHPERSEGSTKPGSHARALGSFAALMMTGSVNDQVVLLPSAYLVL
jgi:hypothetical protein